MSLYYRILQAMNVNSWEGESKTDSEQKMSLQSRSDSQLFQTYLAINDFATNQIYPHKIYCWSKTISGRANLIAL